MDDELDEMNEPDSEPYNSLLAEELRCSMNVTAWQTMTRPDSRHTSAEAAMTTGDAVASEDEHRALCGAEEDKNVDVDEVEEEVEEAEEDHETMGEVVEPPMSGRHTADETDSETIPSVLEQSNKEAKAATITNTTSTTTTANGVVTTDDAPADSLLRAAEEIIVDEEAMHEDEVFDEDDAKDEEEEEEVSRGIAAAHVAAESTTPLASSAQTQHDTHTNRVDASSNSCNGGVSLGQASVNHVGTSTASPSRRAAPTHTLSPSPLSTADVLGGMAHAKQLATATATATSAMPASPSTHASDTAPAATPVIRAAPGAALLSTPPPSTRAPTAQRRSIEKATNTSKRGRAKGKKSTKSKRRARK